MWSALKAENKQKEYRFGKGMLWHKRSPLAMLASPETLPAPSIPAAGKKDGQKHDTAAPSSSSTNAAAEKKNNGQKLDNAASSSSSTNAVTAKKDSGTENEEAQKLENVAAEPPLPPWSNAKLPKVDGRSLPPLPNGPRRAPKVLSSKEATFD